MNFRFSTMMSASLLAAAAGSPVFAQNSTTATPAAAAMTPPPTFVPDNNWSVRIEARVWYVAPEGDLTMPGSAPGTAPVKLSTLHADDPEASGAGQVTIRIPQNEEHTWGTPEFWKSGWLFSVSGASFSGDSDTTAGAGFTIGSLAVAGGAAVNTDIKWTTFQALAGKWITGSDFGTGGDVHIDLYAVTGLRVHTQDITITSGGGSTTANETFGSAVLGVRLDLQLPGKFAIDLDLNANFWPGDPSSTGFDIAPTFTWRPTNNLGIQIGYRLLFADCEAGNENGSNYYKLDGSLAGLFAGVEIRF